ncbi:MAG: nickel pincer cofactor biosynthesis protein LarB [Candidatus Helarchaeota archaeon]
MERIRELLERLRKNEIEADEVEKRIKKLYIEEIERLACFDLYREYRAGFPEVIFAENKDVESIIKIASEVIEKKGHVMVSRLAEEKYGKVKEAILRKFRDKIEIIYNKLGRIANFQLKGLKKQKLTGKVGIITAGTSDIYIAEEAKTVIEEMGAQVVTSYDVGIAGFHRIFPPLKNMIEEDVDIIIVVAGMEGTLPSVVASLVDVPVIGVPSPTGYGLGRDGIGALTTMLQSCAPGLVVVNIGNGFGAAVVALLFLKRIQKYIDKK